ncbi:MAG: hypothetical protein AAF842_08650 [Planctomycetota bacterium]
MSRPARRSHPFATAASAALALALLGVGVGCDSEQARADRSLQDAIAQVHAAERGFADAGESESAYRQGALADAIGSLDEARGQGGPSAAAAAQLAAHIYASAANDAVGRALSAYASLAPDAAGLVSGAAAAQVTAASASSATIDRSPAIATLGSRLTELNADRDAARRAVNDLEATVARLTAQVADHRGEASRALAESRRLNSEAMSQSTSRAAYDMEEKAADAEMASLKASVAAERVQADLNLESSRLAIAKAQLAEAEGAIGRVQDRLAAERERSQAEQATATNADNAREATVDQLAEDFDAVTQRYAAEVDALFVEALDDAGRAVDAAEQGVRLSSGPATNAARRDLLAAQLTESHVLSQRALTAGMFSDVTQAVANAVKPIDPADGDKFATNAADTADIARADAELAQQKLDEALALANQINNTDAAALASSGQSIRDSLQAAGLLN